MSRRLRSFVVFIGAPSKQRFPTTQRNPVLQATWSPTTNTQAMNADNFSFWWGGTSTARLRHLSMRARACQAVGRLMKLLLAALLGCIAGAATADTSKSGVPPQGIDLFSSKSGFQCAPSPLGSGTWPRLRSNAAGTVAWWYCQGSSGEWYLNFAAATAANLSASKLWDDFYTVITASDPVAAFHAAVAKRVTASMNDPSLKPVWQPFLAEMLSGAPAAGGKQSVAVVEEADPDASVVAVR
jgi:hypothetical protein